MAASATRCVRIVQSNITCCGGRVFHFLYDSLQAGNFVFQHLSSSASLAIRILAVVLEMRADALLTDWSSAVTFLKFGRDTLANTMRVFFRF